MEDAGDQFEDDLLKAMQNSLEVNTVPLPAATQPNPAYRGMYNYLLTYMIFILRRLQKYDEIFQEAVRKGRHHIRGGRGCLI